MLNPIGFAFGSCNSAQIDSSMDAYMHVFATKMGVPDGAERKENDFLGRASHGISA